jgi:hypothetical protein
VSSSMRNCSGCQKEAKWVASGVIMSCSPWWNGTRARPATGRH